MWMRALDSQLTRLCLLFITMIPSALTTPLPLILSLPSSSSLQFYPRDRYILSNNTVTGELHAINPNTLQPVPQGPATDGSGSDFDAPALIWMVVTLLLGIFLTFTGFRGWRITTGIGVGLAATVVSWASFINTVNATGIADITLTLICLAFFAAGFVFGCFEIGKLAGMVCLGILGGLSLGVRIMLFKDGLLFPTGDDGSGAGYTLGWALIAVLGVLGGLWIAVVTYQRSGLLFACTATGTFLVALGADLILQRQSGMSRGLIFLFDRNSSHIVDIITKGYAPSVTTQVILGASITFIPIVAFAQHRLFKAPFDRGLLISDSDSVLKSEYGDSSTVGSSSPGILARHRQNASAILNGLWDGTLFRNGSSPNRFSV